MKKRNNHWVNKFLELRFYRQDQLNADFSYKKRSFVQWTANLVYQITQKIKLISLTDNKALILIFLILIVILVIFFNPYSDIKILKENLYPEIFGFLLEGLLLTGLLTYFNDKKERKRRENIRLILRQHLLPFIDHINKNYSSQSKYKVDLQNPETLYFIIKIWSIYSSSEDSVKKENTLLFFRAHSQNIKESVDFFIPIMAEMSPEILTNLLKLKKVLTEIRNENVSENSFTHLVIDLIGIMMELDDKAFIKKPLKKNIQQLMNLAIIQK